MKSFVLASLAASVMALTEVESAFFSYIVKFGKSYNNVSEYDMRLHQFTFKHAMIESHNASDSSYKMGHNQFSDWTEAEYLSILTYIEEDFTNAPEFVSKYGDDVQAIDWRDKGCVNAIKDQGQCGSCWAFGTTATVEGAYCSGSDELLSFSEQELVDCVTLSFGCDGGNPTTAFRYLQSHSEMLEAAYPYTSGVTKKNGSCQYMDDNTSNVRVTDHAMITAKNVDAMKVAL